MLSTVAVYDVRSAIDSVAFAHPTQFARDSAIPRRELRPGPQRVSSCSMKMIDADDYLRTTPRAHCTQCLHLILGRLACSARSMNVCALIMDAGKC